MYTLSFVDWSCDKRIGAIPEYITSRVYIPFVFTTTTCSSFPVAKLLRIHTHSSWTFVLTHLTPSTSTGTIPVDRTVSMGNTDSTLIKWSNSYSSWVPHGLSSAPSVCPWCSLLSVSDRAPRDSTCHSLSTVTSGAIEFPSKSILRLFEEWVAFLRCQVAIWRSRNRAIVVKW